MSTTLLLPKRRQQWFRDRNGIWTTTKHKDATETYSIDYTDRLNSGETISSITATGNGVTVTSSAVGTGIGGASTAVDLTIDDSDGHVKLSVTTSDSRVLVNDLRFLGVPLADPESDYRGRW